MNFRYGFDQVKYFIFLIQATSNPKSALQPGNELPRELEAPQPDVFPSVQNLPASMDLPTTEATRIPRRSRSGRPIKPPQRWEPEPIRARSLSSPRKPKSISRSKSPAPATPTPRDGSLSGELPHGPNVPVSYCALSRKLRNTIRLNAVVMRKLNIIQARFNPFCIN